ncbi:ABC-type transport system involved in multi-copper enzyme maturation, permease component [Natronobacterium gregoryi SP2]|nr:ABC-type transport system involved in multi-copper enzyme maturation, permease component [Natronobacterium gregoryi SP2]
MFGRGTALLVPVVASTLLVVGYDAVQYGRFSLALLLGLVLLSTVYVFVWMGLLVGISAMSSSTTRAVAIGSLVTTVFFLWNDLTAPVLWNFVTGTTPGTELAYPALFEAAKWVSPFSAYNVVASWLFGAPLGPEVPLSQVADAFNDAGEFVPADPPLPSWSGAVFLLSWPVVSLVAGIMSFQRTDLAPHNSTRLRALFHRFPVPALPGGRGLRKAGATLSGLLPGSWQPLARREFRRLVRSPLVWVVGALVFLDGIISLSPEVYVQEALGSSVPLAAVQRPIMAIAAIGVLFGTFRSVVRERDTGRIRLTAGTAVSRTESLLGFVLGRASAFAVPVFAAVLLTCLIAGPQYGLVPAGELVAFLALTFLFLVVMAGIGVAISTVLRSQSVAGFAAMVFVVVSIMWQFVANTVYEVVTGTAVTGFNPPENLLYVLLRWLPPGSLYNVATNYIIDVPNSGAISSLVISHLQPNRISNAVVVRISYGTDVPVWYLHPSVGLVGLLLWFVVPLGLSALVHRRRSVD